jgi:hypothetical protein
VYNNFYTFFNLHPQGIYTEYSGSVVGGHCVKMVGWGTQSGQDYWLFANSWDTTWGDGGYFKMARGTNLCGIEGSVSEGFTPKQAKTLAKPRGTQNANADLLVGGWHQQSQTDDDENIVRAADAGLELLGAKLHRQMKLSEIVSAQTQVVAGVNYRLDITVQDGSKVSLKVHRDLSSSYSLVEYQFLF